MGFDCAEKHLGLKEALFAQPVSNECATIPHLPAISVHLKHFLAQSCIYKKV